MLSTGKETLRALALEAGFTGARFLAPAPPGCRRDAASLLVTALPYGNLHDDGPEKEVPAGAGYIAPFARRNYYREAVKRLQKLSVEFRARFGGKKSDFQILCNSPAPEKPLALASGLGVPGRNGLIITEEAGSLVIIAAMTLPFALEGDGGGAAGEFPRCKRCDTAGLLPCREACPTGAIRGDGALILERCIQWYASGKGGHVPPGVARRWGNRLYGCTCCQDACVHNRRPIRGVETGEGHLPAYFDCRELLSLDDDALKARFKGSVMGLSWLGPAAIRRNARMALLFSGGDPDPFGQPAHDAV